MVTRRVDPIVALHAEERWKKKMCETEDAHSETLGETAGFKEKGYEVQKTIAFKLRSLKAVTWWRDLRQERRLEVGFRIAQKSRKEQLDIFFSAY